MSPEMFHTFTNNPTCRHIIFGACNDAGYLLDLDRIKHNVAKAGRITLLETTPAPKGFEGLTNFKRIRFDDVFKSQPLSNATGPISTYTHSPTQSMVQPLSRTTTTRVSPTITPRASLSSPSPSTTPSVATAGSNDTNVDSSWGAYKLSLSTSSKPIGYAIDISCQ